MSYGTIGKCVQDQVFRDRVSACAAQEQIARDESVDPTKVINDLIWPVASSSDVESAYASALAAHNPNPGGDESVITDGMILSHVQANWPTP